MTARPTLQTAMAVLILTLTCSTARAARHYDIELALFKYTDTEHFSGEHWPTQWTIPDTDDALDINRVPAERRNEFRRLDDSRRTLRAIVNSLEKSSRYEVLAYSAWRQPGLDSDNAVDILIRAGDRYEKQSRGSLPDDERPAQGTLFLRPGEVHDRPGGGYTPGRNRAPAGNPRQQDTPLTENYRRISANSEIAPADLVYELEGTVKIVLSRFLHIYTDLLLMQPVRLEALESAAAQQPDSAAPELATVKPEAVQRYKVIPAGDDQSFTTLQGVNIQLHRRMRSGELHHLDHPLLGMIVKITPVEKEND